MVSPSASCVAKWWKYYEKFNSVAHPSMKGYAACTLCFVVGKIDKGTISIKGGGTGGIRRHLLNNHTREFEILDAGKKTVVGGGNSMIANHFKPRGKEMSLRISSHYLSWQQHHGPSPRQCRSRCLPVHPFGECFSP